MNETQTEIKANPEVEALSPLSSWDDIEFAALPEAHLTGRDLLDYMRSSLHIDVVDELIKKWIINDEFDKRKLEFSDEELEQEINRFRLDRHLLTSASTDKWLEKHHLNSSDLWTIFEQIVKAKKLKLALFDDEYVSEQFALKKVGLSKATYYQIVVKQQNKATELAALIRHGNSFFDLARVHSEDEQSKGACGFVGSKFLYEIEPEIQFKITNAQDGDVFGPIKCIGNYYLIFLEHLAPAVLDEETMEGLRDQLFENWCAKRVSSTPIELLV